MVYRFIELRSLSTENILNTLTYFEFTIDFEFESLAATEIEFEFHYGPNSIENSIEFKKFEFRLISTQSSVYISFTFYSKIFISSPYCNFSIFFFRLTCILFKNICFLYKKLSLKIRQISNSRRANSRQNVQFEATNSRHPTRGRDLKNFLPQLEAKTPFRGTPIRGTQLEAKLKKDEHPNSRQKYPSRGIQFEVKLKKKFKNFYWTKIPNSRQHNSRQEWKKTHNFPIRLFVL